ncbi:MAG: hypothetical protein MI919_30340, partial [Holophagales bacterium]|nr:hypothetical protein [Holophagales bacterium]
AEPRRTQEPAESPEPVAEAMSREPRPTDPMPPEAPPERQSSPDLAAEMAREMAELRKRMEEMEQRLASEGGGPGASE